MIDEISFEYWENNRVGQNKKYICTHGIYRYGEMSKGVDIHLVPIREGVSEDSILELEL